MGDMMDDIPGEAFTEEGGGEMPTEDRMGESEEPEESGVDGILEEIGVEFEEEELECEEGETEVDVLLFTFVMLLLGLVAKNLLSKVPILKKIPYTGMLLLIGLSLGFLHTELRPDVHANGSVIEGPTERKKIVDGEEFITIEELSGEFRKGYEHLGRGIQAWASISPELLLLIHLPALIFASGFSLDFHIVRRNFWQILILAGPGVAIGTIFTALIAKYIFPYDWCWPKSLMFGAMLSATDPVAVVALLKEVGASATLGTVIEGESLFNDGTAFVFFLLFRDLIRWTTSCNNGECNDAELIDEALCDEENIDFIPACEFPHRDVGGSFRFFARMALGAPALGIAFAIGAATWINFVYNDLVVEVAITLVTAYLTYFTADVLLKMSGVLATVALGIVMTVLAKPRLSPKSHEPMEVFWEMVEYFANTMIFIYAGVKIAIVLWEKSINPVDNQEKFIGAEEWGWAVLLYLFLQVIRLVTILICWPFLLLSGYHVDWKDVCVMTWGGLRGAVGLALSLIVDLDIHTLDPKFRALTIFYMGTMAASTLVFNGTSMPYILAMLGTTKPKPEKLEVLLHVVKEMEHIGDQELREFEPDDLLGDPDPGLVMKLTQLDVSSVIPSNREVDRVIRDAAEANNPVAIELEQHMHQNIHEKHSTGGDVVMAAAMRYASASGGKDDMKFDGFNGKDSAVTKDMLVMDFRRRVLTGVKSVYGELNEEGELSAEQNYSLKESVDEALDTVDKPLSDWYYLEHALSVSAWRKYANKLGTSLKFEKPAQALLFQALENSAIMARSFIHAHEEASHSLHEYISFVKKDKNNTNGEVAAAKLVEEAGEQVLDESREELQLGVEFMKNLRRAYPEVARAIKSKLAAWEVLHNKAKYVNQLAKAGLIDLKESNALSQLIEGRIKKLVYHPPQVELPDTRELLHSHPLFADLSRQTFDSQVLPNARPKQYDKQKPIFEIGHESHSLTLVVRGVVKVESPGADNCSVQEGAGAMIGVSEVLLQQRRSRSLIAQTHVEVFHLDARVFIDLVNRYESVRVRAWQMAAAFLTVQYPWGQYRSCSIGELQSVFRHAELREHFQGDHIRFERVSYLAAGELAELKTDGSRKHPISAPTPLNAGSAVYVCLSDIKALQLPDDARPGRFTRRSVGTPRNTLRRNSLSRLSQRSNRIGGQVSQDHSTITPGGLGGIPESGTFKERSQNQNGSARKTGVQEPEPTWQMDESVMSADMQLRNEVQRMRPTMARASTGVTPSRSTKNQI